MDGVRVSEALNNGALILAIMAGLFGTGWLAKVIVAAARVARDLDELGRRVNGVLSVATMAKETADSNTHRIVVIEEGDRHQWTPVREALASLAIQVTALAGQLGEWREKESRELGEITARLDGIEGRLNRRDNERRD